MLLEIWLAGSVAASACCAYDYKRRSKKLTADHILACMIFSWVIVAAYAGERLALCVMRRAAIADRNPSGGDVQQAPSRSDESGGANGNRSNTVTSSITPQGDAA